MVAVGGRRYSTICRLAMTIPFQIVNVSQMTKHVIDVDVERDKLLMFALYVLVRNPCVHGLNYY